MKVAALAVQLQLVAAQVPPPRASPVSVQASFLVPEVETHSSAALPSPAAQEEVVSEIASLPVHRSAPELAVEARVVPPTQYQSVALHAPPPDASPESVHASFSVVEVETHSSAALPSPAAQAKVVSEIAS